MLSRLFRRTLKLNQASTRFTFASATTGGNLYTWGLGSAGLGSELATGSTELENPVQIEGFDNNVAKVAMGPTHTAVVTTNGELYTFGFCHYGVLGHGERDVSRYEPTLVEYFAENNVKVKDVAVGKYHTVALAENGDVYTWGYGGKSRNPIANWFNPTYGALGVGTNVDHYEPTLVEELEGGSRDSLVSGNNFVALLNGGNLYNWGIGTKGVLASGTAKHLKSPLLNDAIHHLSEHDGIKVVKIKAGGDSVLALFDDGSVYGWGDNDLGQLGVKKDVGIELYEEIHEPTKIDDTNIKGQKIVDFDIGEEISVFLTDQGQVYWAGLKLCFAPEHVPLPEGVKVKKVAAVSPGVAILTENNEIYATQQLTGNARTDIKSGLYKVKNDAFNGGQILEVGGQYFNRFAIVKN